MILESFIKECLQKNTNSAFNYQISVENYLCQEDFTLGKRKEKFCGFQIFHRGTKGFDTQKNGGDENFNFLIFLLEIMGATFDLSMIPPPQLKRNVGRGKFLFPSVLKMNVIPPFYANILPFS